MAAGDAAGEGIPFVGLTGGIGAGKSEALRALERLGAATLSSDAVVHEILATDEARDDLVERLGDEVAPAGRVDRDAVARIVFDDPDGRRWLEEDLLPPPRRPPASPARGRTRAAARRCAGAGWSRCSRSPRSAGWRRSGSARASGRSARSPCRFATRTSSASRRAPSGSTRR